MKGVYNAILNGKAKEISIIELEYFLKYILTHPKKQEIFEDVMPRLLKKYNSNELFTLIYKIKDLEYYTFYLLHKNMVNIDELPGEIYKNLIDNTTWGLDFIKKNIDIIAKNKMQNLITLCIYNNSLYREFLNAFKNKRSKCEFIEKILMRKQEVHLTKNDIITAITEDNNFEQLTFEPKNKRKLIPNNIGHLIVWNKKFKDIVNTYAEELFESEQTHKISFLSLLSDNYQELKEKYKVALNLYFFKRNPGIDIALSNLITYGNYDDFSKKILELSPNLNLDFLGLGSTSTVFCINNTILKIGYERWKYSIPDNFFRIIPRKVEYIKNKKGNICCVIEWQPKINTNENNITEEMIYQLLIDFKKNNLKIIDPHCLKLDKENFGILKNYKDANLGNFNSHEELPEYFKKNPLVLLDVDLIYEKNEKIPHDFPLLITMDEVIKTYEEAIAYKQKIKRRDS